MSFVTVSPELVTAAAQNVASIGSALEQAHAVAAPATTSVVAAAGDEISAAIAAVFSGHGQAFQAASAQAARVHSQFVQALSGAAGAYAAAEGAAAGTLTQRWPAPRFLNFGHYLTINPLNDRFYPYHTISNPQRTYGPGPDHSMYRIGSPLQPLAGAFGRLLAAEQTVASDMRWLSYNWVYAPVSPLHADWGRIVAADVQVVEQTVHLSEIGIHLP